MGMIKSVKRLSMSAHRALSIIFPGLFALSEDAKLNVERHRGAVAK